MRKLTNTVETTIAFFTVLGIIFIPFPFSFGTFQLPVTEFIFGNLIGGISETLFSLHLKNTKVYSDSVSMYILLLILFLLAVIITLLLNKWNWWKQRREKILTFCYHVACYYLVLQLLKYGAGKIFKDQFYLPEPNILFSPVGKISKDLLFWSSMGSSYLYNLITGLVEILAALILLSGKTRLLGLLVSMIALMQIVVINFSFDISVKLFSLFLLFLNLYLMSPYFKRMYQFFFSVTTVQADSTSGVVLISHPFVNVFIKSLVIGLIFIEVLFPYIKTRNFNDDMVNRPFLHGAYEVRHLLQGSDTLTEANFPVKRFFIHRSGYIIFQSPDDEMQDYKLSYDNQRQLLIIQDYLLKQSALKYQYFAADSLLKLQYFKGDKEYVLIGKGLDWRKLPLLKREFHWTIDE